MPQRKKKTLLFQTPGLQNVRDKTEVNYTSGEAILYTYNTNKQNNTCHNLCHYTLPHNGMALCCQLSAIYFTAVNKRHKYNTRLASRSSYTLPPIMTNYGTFSIKFQGVKRKSLRKLTFSHINMYLFIFFSTFILYYIVNDFNIACFFTRGVVNIIVFCNELSLFFLLSGPVVTSF